MSNLFGVKSELSFEPRAEFDSGTLGVQYTTPSPWRITTGAMALINGVSAVCKYHLRRSAGAVDIVCTLRIKTQAGAVVAEETVTAPASTDTNGSFVVDVGAVSGGSPLLMEIEVDTNDGGTTATMYAVMQFETPVVAGGC